MSDPIGTRDADPQQIILGIVGARHRSARVALAARFLIAAFDIYYREEISIPEQAQHAFETRAVALSLYLSRRRMSNYSLSIHTAGPRLVEAWPELAESIRAWDEVEAAYEPLVAKRYEHDLAMSWLHSLRRALTRNITGPVDYTYGKAATRRFPADGILRRFPGGSSISPRVVEAILGIPDFSAPWRDLKEDARLIARRLNESFNLDGTQADAVEQVEMIDAGFFRNRGAYLVGRIVLADGSRPPLMIALDNTRQGIFADAVLTREADLHNVFSTTLASFHVTSTRFHEIASFLHQIMPRRPLGIHYSTVGYNHTGKPAVVKELARELDEAGERLDTAAGFRGTVAIGFSAPGSNYVLKVIRDTPTKHYKWGAFAGVEKVLEKYRRVHEINRTGSMLDNIVFEGVRLPAGWFAETLRAELLEAAPSTVSETGGHLVFRHLIAQTKMTPLPLYLKTASDEQAAAAMVNLGHCIKNNAAANIFNKDLDARNYGVSRFGKVFLFDYDAVEPLLEVKIFTNAGREDGEEAVPEWVFETGVVFLPEELDAGLMLDDRRLRRLFREAHPDILTVDYWKGMQRALRKGWVPRIAVYPASTKLRAEVAPAWAART
jgi:isocitrate dehydrogenase kinase/phosphatase